MRKSLIFSYHPENGLKPVSYPNCVTQLSLGKNFTEYVSKQKASRVDVARLRETLDQKLMERQARESGICQVREELFEQCFDEIIRQVALREPERGILLHRVKLDIQKTINAYKTLYQR